MPHECAHRRLVQAARGVARSPKGVPAIGTAGEASESRDGSKNFPGLRPVEAVQVTRGGHIRSGRSPDPYSGRSERRGYRQPRRIALPADGFKGRVPGLNQFLPKPKPRHRELWNELWRTPQAVAWANERWRWTMIADLVKYIERSDDVGCPGAYLNAIRQLRDELGLSVAGLKANGWEISEDEVATQRGRREQVKLIPHRLAPPGELPPLRLRGPTPTKRRLRPPNEASS